MFHDSFFKITLFVWHFKVNFLTIRIEYFITNLSLADINSAQPSHPIKKGVSFQRNCGAVLEGEYNRQGN